MEERSGVYMNIIDRLGFDIHFKERYFVRDLMGSENIKVLFILESPHISEISDKLPASGQTGQIMSKVLLNDNSSPFGKLLKDGEPQIKKFAVMNVLQIPMQLYAYDAEDRQQQKLTKISDLRNSNGNPYKFSEHKAKIKEACDNDMDISSVFMDFSSRLNNFIKEFKPKLIVPCGIVVQAFFEMVHQRTFNLGVVSTISCRGHSFNVFYMYHPSPRSGNDQSKSKWDTDQSNIRILRKEIEKV